MKIGWDDARLYKTGQRGEFNVLCQIQIAALKETVRHFQLYLSFIIDRVTGTLQFGDHQPARHVSVR